MELGRESGPGDGLATLPEPLPSELAPEKGRNHTAAAWELSENLWCSRDVKS
jgi:hypothetical protein